MIFGIISPFGRKIIKSPYHELSPNLIIQSMAGKNGQLKRNHVDADVLFLHTQYISRGGKQHHPF